MYPFKEITYFSHGNPHIFDDVPISFNRNVISLLLKKDLVTFDTPGIIPNDHKYRAKKYLDIMGNADIGAYSYSTGFSFVRDSVCKFLKKRDGWDSDPNNIILTNGASEGVRIILEIVLGQED